MHDASVIRSGIGNLASSKRTLGHTKVEMHEHVCLEHEISQSETVMFT